MQIVKFLHFAKMVTVDFLDDREEQKENERQTHQRQITLAQNENEERRTDCYGEIKRANKQIRNKTACSLSVKNNLPLFSHR